MISDKREFNLSLRQYSWILYIYIYIYMLARRIEKKRDWNCTRMWIAMLNKSWKQHPTKQQLYGHSPPIFKTIQVKWSEVLLWTPAQERGSFTTYRQQLCADTGSSLKDLPRAMDDPIYQPLRSGSIWHKVHFLAEFNRFEFRVFLLLD